MPALSSCEAGHRQIYFFEEDCPLCHANRQMEDLEAEIRELKEEIHDLKMADYGHQLEA